jgi:hypothetical protein
MKFMSQNQISSESKTKEKISICEIMKSSTSKTIQKLESQIPLKLQQYSDLYTAYLHTIDNLYGSCYLSEKEFFDKLNIDQRVLKSIDDLNKSATHTLLNQIDLSAKYGQQITQLQISSLRVYDDFFHILLDSYAKTLSMLNNYTNQNNK